MRSRTPCAGSYQLTVPSRPSGAAGGRVGGDADAQRLGAAVVLADLELDGLTLAEQLRAAVADDLGGVHEQVRRSVLGREEAETPFGVEPADGSLGHG